MLSRSISYLYTVNHNMLMQLQKLEPLRRCGPWEIDVIPGGDSAGNFPSFLPKFSTLEFLPLYHLEARYGELLYIIFLCECVCGGVILWAWYITYENI